MGMKPEMDAASPEWWARRRTDWHAAVTAAQHARDERDTLRAERDTLRAEMVTAIVSACDFLQRGHDWTLRDCEHFSAMLAALADRTARIRASVTREERMQ